MIKNEKGNAMLLSILIFATTFIFTLTVIIIGGNSHKHAEKEEKKTRAYYVAKTGAESVIKHLEDKFDKYGEDIRPEIIELLKKTQSRDIGKGAYKEGDFEIEVKESTRRDKDGKDKRVYLVESKGIIGEGKHKGEDRVTAVLFPRYTVENSWGTGTVDAGEKVFVKGLHNLEGNGIILNTTKEKRLDSKSGPIEIQEGYSDKEEIMKLFTENPGGTIEKYGYKLKRIDTDSTYIKSERLEYDKLPVGSKPVTLNYGVERKTPEINIPIVNSEGIDLKNKVVDASKSTTSIGNFVTAPYDVIEFENDGTPVKKTQNKEFLKIEASRLQFFGDNEIKTTRNKDVVIYTKNFSLMEAAKLNITGPGKVYIYVTEKIDLINKSSLGVDLHIDLDNRVVNTNIHMYIANEDVQIGNYTEVSNTYIYGKKANVQLAGNSIYTGRISAHNVAFRDNITLRSPAPKDEDETTDPIEGFKEIEWER